ncbi:MAG: sodium:proton antiporter [Candidatus Lernaella stagnicola]|nr:sodium:proton antiporter [Candidatus Lernaella stagnicola]
MEEETLLIGLGSILVLGITARWLAWRLHLPSILLLLLVGFLAGPVTGFLHPDELLGELLFPVVSLAVAVILFEGGMSLKIKSLREDGFTIARLVTIGALITWGLGTLAARYLLNFEWGMATLLGAILIVTGPTVVIPLLLYIRPVGRIGSIAKWEGIVNDPIGAIIAVLVYEALIIGAEKASAWFVVLGLTKAFLFGGLLGAAGAVLIVILMKRHWLPDLLQEPVVLMTAIGVFIGANVVQAESGLLAVTVMGIVLANQSQVSVKHIIEFKERLRVLLISGLFVLLAARLQFAHMKLLGWGSVAFLVFLVLINRPAMVFLSTIGSRLNWREKIFLSWMAPRGIVAAAVASLFALELADRGYARADELMAQVFFVIVATVILYGVTAAPLARRLRLAQAMPQGVLFVSAHDWVREIAKAIRNENIQVVLVDTNQSNVLAAMREGLDAYHENIVSLQAIDNVPLHGVGRLFALTRNDEANALAALRFTELFGRSEVYQITPHTDFDGSPTTDSPKHLRGRLLFHRAATYENIGRRFAHGARVKTIQLTEDFDYQAFLNTYGEHAMPLAIITMDRKLLPFTAVTPPTPQPGQKVLALIDPV